jgi:hypothetical protein
MHTFSFSTTVALARHIRAFQYRRQLKPILTKLAFKNVGELAAWVAEPVTEANKRFLETRERILSRRNPEKLRQESRDLDVIETVIGRRRQKLLALLAAGAAASLLFPYTIAHAGCAHSDEANLLTHGCYTTRDGVEVHRPSRTKDGKPPIGYAAKCQDDSWSFSQHPGDPDTCSYHGGVVR